MAKPVLPVERLDINRTSSINSLVAPTVSRTFLPCNGFGRMPHSTQSRILSRLASLPFPSSSQASLPTSGSIITTPLFFNFSMFSCTAGFCHISTLQAGASISKPLWANTQLVRRLSAMPLAILERVFTLHGAIKKRSHQRGSVMCKKGSSSSQSE